MERNTQWEFENMETFDVLIAGAGPAGLSLAAELAGSARVCLLERDAPCHTTATWYSYLDRVRDHGLDEAIAFRSDRVVFRSRNEEHAMRDECVVLDHHRMLRLWLNRAVDGGAAMVRGGYRSHRADETGVTVQTTAGALRARVLIDCMGPQSPIVAANRLIRRKDAWVLWGARIALPPGSRKPEIEYYPLGDEANTYVGVHPFSETERNVYVFQGRTNTLGEPEQLRPVFEAMLAEQFPGARILAPLRGCISSGVLRRYALDRVLFFGAAGMMNPEAIGMGFNEVLRQVRGVAAGVRRALADNRLDARTLERVALNQRDRETLYFQRVIGAFSLHFVRSSSKWDGGVRWLNLLGEQSRWWMRNELTFDWIVEATLKLHRAVPLRESVRLIPVRDLFFILEQLVRFVWLVARRRAAEALGVRRWSLRIE
jgi:2-polyprenyl-6-methoxyphenol hydroxylase-like FAD-dependent oxidoreductase